jgi:hypothetical protein
MVYETGPLNMTDVKVGTNLPLAKTVVCWNHYKTGIVVCFIRNYPHKNEYIKEYCLLPVEEIRVGGVVFREKYSIVNFEDFDPYHDENDLDDKTRIVKNFFCGKTYNVNYDCMICMSRDEIPELVSHVFVINF